MWGFSGGMLFTGVLLGLGGRNTSLKLRFARLRSVVVAATVVTVALAAMLPYGWLKFILVVLQAPLVGLAITLA